VNPSTFSCQLNVSKKRLVFAMFLGAFFCTAHDTDAQERSKTSKYLKEAAEVLSGLMGRAEDDGFRLEKAMTLAGGWIDKSDKWTGLYQLTLQEGSTYRFMAAGDIDATDVDIRLTDPSGNVMVKDESVARTAVVNFTPRKTIFYTVEIRLYASSNNVPCVCLTSVYKR
jgi:hypothetical protein